MLDKKHDGFFDEETTEDRKSAELLEKIESEGANLQIKAYSTGDKVEGKVTRVGTDYVFIDIGAKNEAMIKVIEAADAKVGDTIGGVVISQSGGETVISKSVAAAGTADISVLRDALNARLPVQGKVTGVSKSGLTVKIMGHRAFCPVSQIDVKFTADVNEYLGKTLDFVISRITEGGKNIVVSRVPLFEAGLEEQFTKFADAAGSNKTFTGKISKIVEFGLFVEVGGLEGLVHISEVSWERAQKLNDTFSVGQEVVFVVLKVERKDSMRNSKISLSIKQALEDPWKKVSDAVSVGQSIEGKVTRLADFGAFVEVLPGVEGLVHVSEMAWSRRVHHPSEIVKAGQTVKVTVLGIDLNKRSISLTLKDINEDPWKGIEEKLAVGMDITGTIARKAKFGYFIDIFDGVTGLLVPSRIAADKKDSIKPGDTVTVQIESIDTDSRRVALSLGMGDSAKTDNDTKEYIKKQNAGREKKSGGTGGANAPGGDTEFGAALLAALKTSKPGTPESAEKPKAAAEPKVAEAAVATEKAVGMTVSTPKTVETESSTKKVVETTVSTEKPVETESSTKKPVETAAESTPEKTVETAVESTPEKAVETTVPASTPNPVE